MRHNRSPDEAIAEAGRLQGGLVHLSQLRDLGLRWGAIEHRLKTGRLHRVARGVYAVGHRRNDRAALLHRAVLAGGDGAVISRHAAAAELEVRPWIGPLVDITVARQRRPLAGVRYHRSLLPPDEVVVRNGLPLTSPARTLFDLAGVLPERLFRRAVKDVEVKGHHDRLTLPELIARHPRSPGAAVIRSVIEDDAAPATITPSEGEDLLLDLVRRSGLPEPSHRYGIALAGGWFEVDAAWPEKRLVVEVDSTFHDSRESFEEDRLRDAALTAAGWRVVRVTYRELVRHPDRFLARLRRLLA